MLTDQLHQLITSYGYLAVAGIVGLECLGLPLPGEAALISAAIYAGATGRLTIGLVIAAAAAGAILGGSAGYGLGRVFGSVALRRWGRFVGMRAPQLDRFNTLFLNHGAKLVFFGRFVALLRIFVALFAGANGMPWPRFLVSNIAGSLCWATMFGLGSFWLGDAICRYTGPLAIVGLVVAGITLLVAHRLTQRAIFGGSHTASSTLPLRPTGS
ncbi:MAG: DedA family protein [Azospirillaceae bacterium]|nr:DedA family protein [Azospirillaceae bacterium]